MYVVTLRIDFRPEPSFANFLWKHLVLFDFGTKLTDVLRSSSSPNWSVATCMSSRFAVSMKLLQQNSIAGALLRNSSYLSVGF